MLVLRELDGLASLDVYDDGVAVLERGDRPAAHGLGRDVPDHEPVRRAGEAPVRDERDLVAEALPDDRGSHVQHLAHARPAPRGPRSG